MIKFNSRRPGINSTLMAVSLALSAVSINAQATLTSFTNGGVDLVYSDVSDVTWTKDANLLKTMMDADNKLVSKIISASPTVGYGNNGIYTIKSTDFFINGRVTWWGVNAFATYLNSINYGGSADWQLPTLANRSNTNVSNNINGTTAGDEFAELFYKDLKGTFNKPIPNTDIFNNEQTSLYWTGTQRDIIMGYAWAFSTSIGTQGLSMMSAGDFAWLISPGKVGATTLSASSLNQVAVSAVPVPAAVWLFGSGLLGLVGLRRRQSHE